MLSKTWDLNLFFRLVSLNYEGLYMCQTKYVKKLLSQFSLLSSKLALIPMASSGVLSRSGSVILDGPSTYRSMIDTL